VATVPAGATVYNAADGQELGRTPLELRLPDGESRQLQLRLKGYRMRSMELGADGPLPAPVVLEPQEPAPEQPRPTPRRAPKRKRQRRKPPSRPPQPEAPAELLKDPFGR